MRVREAPRTRVVGNWAVAVILAIVFEGAARKWVLPASLHPVAYLAKDALAFGFILCFPLPRGLAVLSRAQTLVTCIGLLLLPPFLFGAFQVADSAVMTAKNAFLWPLFAVHLAARLDEKSLGRICRLLVVLAIGSAILGGVQFESPAEARINSYAWEKMGFRQAAAQFGPVRGIRATGTFSYITGYGTFAFTAFTWAIFGSLAARRRRERLLCVAGAGASLVCVFASGSRAPLMSCGVALLGMLSLARHVQSRARVGGLILTFAAVWVVYLQGPVGNAFVERWRTAGDNVRDRASGAGLDFIDVLVRDPFGQGLGRQSNLQTYRLSVEASDTRMAGSEDSRMRMVSEGGILALFAYLLTIVLVLTLAFRTWHGLSAEGRIATGAVVPLAVLGAVSCAWFDHNAAALMWLSVGMWASVAIRKPAGYGILPSRAQAEVGTEPAVAAYR